MGNGTGGNVDMVANCVAYHDGKKIRDITIDEISDFIEQPGTFVWLGLCEPDEPLMAAFVISSEAPRNLPAWAAKSPPNDFIIVSSMLVAILSLLDGWVRLHAAPPS